MHGAGPLLILAGAGSGKTRVLTRRVAHLIEELGVPAYRICAFTFTNKAAGEMGARLEALLGPAARELWAGTFHSICVRILRRETVAAGYSPGFSIYDEEDQLSVIRRVLRESALSEKEFEPKRTLHRISRAKERLVGPDAFAENAVSPHEKSVAVVYERYQRVLRELNAFDFDDLIGVVVRLLETDDALRRKYAGRFEHVLVDEYQDTNHAQYRLLRVLASEHRNVCAVGDDDQSIYAFRGADISNILSFEQSFPEATILHMEQNYRSTQAILDVANAVVKNNVKRKPKTLWTENAGGSQVEFVLASDERAEADEIVKTVRREFSEGRRRWRDFAVLYRTNAQSRAIEEAMRNALLPYRLVGGVYFYQRREVRDLLSYLRILVNPADEESLRRAVSAPKRGIGDVSVARFLEFGRAERVAPTALLARAEEAPGVPAAAARQLVALGALLAETPRDHVAQAMRFLIDRLAFREYVESIDPETAQSRRENVEELAAGAQRFAESVEEPTVERYLSEISLYTDLDRWDETSDAVTLMTVHNAKGLEFPHVFVAGCEEGLLPHASSLGDPSELEEERRLFYVAITRSRENATLLSAARRFRFGAGEEGEVSRFIREIPAELLAWRETGDFRSSYATAPARRERRAAAPRTVDAGGGRRYVYDADEVPSDDGGLVGTTVSHPRFGRGVVVEHDGQGPNARVVVQFHAGYRKKLVARYLDWPQ